MLSYYYYMLIYSFHAATARDMAALFIALPFKALFFYGYERFTRPREREEAKEAPRAQRRRCGQDIYMIAFFAFFSLFWDDILYRDKRALLILLYKDIYDMLFAAFRCCAAVFYAIFMRTSIFAAAPRAPPWYKRYDIILRYYCRFDIHIYYICALLWYDALLYARARARAKPQRLFTPAYARAHAFHAILSIDKDIYICRAILPLICAAMLSLPPPRTAAAPADAAAKIFLWHAARHTCFKICRCAAAMRRLYFPRYDMLFLFTRRLRCHIKSAWRASALSLPPRFMPTYSIYYYYIFLFIIFMIWYFRWWRR